MNLHSEKIIVEPALAPQIIRGALGGLLMGLANLVPGISGGTMLLAAGVYPQFIDGIAEITRFRFRARSMMAVGSIVLTAALAIAAFAGVVRGLVVDHRWIMYSLFIGLTLGGVPVVWRLLRKLTSSAAVACAAGIGVMAVMAMVQPGEATGGQGGLGAYLILFVAGLAGSSAMILPGVSGGYLLLILGQYLTILGAIDQAKTALLQAGGPDWPVVLSAFHVFIPVGLGVLVGAVGVSNLMRFFLARYEKATLGLLLGLLLGAVLGLWPFQQTVPPDPGDVIRGQVMTAETIATLDPKYYPMEKFPPSGGQLASAAGLVALGGLVTYGVALVGKER
jgi:putative membrane protein